MASTFVLSGTTTSQSRRHHGHGHANSRSRSPKHMGTLNRSFKLDMSSASMLSDHDNHHHDHDHSYSHSLSSNSAPHEYDHSHSHSLHTHSHSPSGGNRMQPRQHVPPPVLTGNGLITTSTATGKLRVTPRVGSVSEPYTAPETKPKHAHDLSAERSTFTNLLLPFTAKWPLLHTVMTEKDSRRIFYFMRYVLCVPYSLPNGVLIYTLQQSQPLLHGCPGLLWLCDRLARLAQ